MIKVAIVDDNPAFLTKLSSCLRRNSTFLLVHEAQDGNELIYYLNAAKDLPDIVLCDVNMPKMDGVAVTDYLTENFPAIKVIGLSTFVGKNTVEDMLASGAWGYLVKVNLADLHTAILSVTDGQVYICDLISEDIQKREILVAERLDRKVIKQNFNLSFREQKFIALNATSMDYKEIGKIMFVEPKTVDTFFNRISKKLNIKNRQSLTLFALRRGLARIARLK